MHTCAGAIAECWKKNSPTADTKDPKAILTLRDLSRRLACNIPTNGHIENRDVGKGVRVRSAILAIFRLRPAAVRSVPIRQDDTPRWALMGSRALLCRS